MNNIKVLRAERNISQQELANQVHVHQTAVSQWESGKTNPDTQQAIVLANFFDVSVDFLLGRTDERRSVYNATNIPDSQLVQGNGTIEVNGGRTFLSREESELVRVYRVLGVKDGLKLLDYAFKLELGESNL
ncbi:hypothetical protein AGMMS49975_26730 [Clostridia bacterium]|nr:hypothetical protein AGMMS49975_26730 [Clostridia bacterium]